MPLRGRDAVLRAVGRMLDQARSGHGRLVFVTGEAGIGKTALVREAAHLAQGRQMEVASAADLAPSDVYVIEPGHDAWVVGDEPFVGVEFDNLTASLFAKGLAATAAFSPE